MVAWGSRIKTGASGARLLNCSNHSTGVHGGSGKSRKMASKCRFCNSSRAAAGGRRTARDEGDERVRLRPQLPPLREPQDPRPRAGGDPSRRHSRRCRGALRLSGVRAVRPRRVQPLPDPWAAEQRCPTQPSWRPVGSREDPIPEAVPAIVSPPRPRPYSGQENSGPPSAFRLADAAWAECHRPAFAGHEDLERRLEATTRWLAANGDAFLSVAATANAGSWLQGAE